MSAIRCRRRPSIMPIVPMLLTLGGGFGQCDDWPTFLHDNHRSGASASVLQLPLSPAWICRWPAGPQPAWPPPARQDFWNQRVEKPRVTYDWAFELVSDGERVYFGTSADYQLVCLDGNTGRLLWQHATQAPLRLAPTLAGGLVLFGGDDGFVTACEAVRGDVRWSRKVVPDSYWLPGNGHLIASHPVRTGVLALEGRGYVCAGIFPTAEVRYEAFDLNTGQTLAHAALDSTADGYLRLVGSKMVVGTGRDPVGSVVGELSRRGMSADPTLKSTVQSADHWIATPTQLVIGKEQRVVVLDRSTGDELWSATVDGNPYSLAIAGDRLLVSTDQGVVYSFGHNVPQTAHDAPPAGNANGPSPSRSMDVKGSFQHVNSDREQACRQQADWIASLVGSRPGYGLVLGCGDGGLLAELVERTSLRWIGVEADGQHCATARANLQRAGIYGKSVVHQANWQQVIAYTQDLFDVVVFDPAITLDDRLSAADAWLPCVHPRKGQLAIAEDRIVRRSPPVDTGEWTHLYANPANTACSQDARVHGPLKLQWFGEPGPRPMLDRHHRGMAPLARDGRLLIVGDERIFAVDLYQGTPLWERSIPGSRRVGVLRDGGNVALGRHYVFAAVREQCEAYSVETGELRKQFPVPRDVARHMNLQRGTHWGVVATQNGMLLGSLEPAGASRGTHDRQTIDDTYYDEREFVMSAAVCAYDVETEKLLWTWSGPHCGIVNSTLTMSRDRICFVNSVDPPSQLSQPGRQRLASCFAQGGEVLALDAHSGAVLWRQSLDLSAVRHQVFGLADEHRMIIVGSRNGPDSRGKSVVWYDIWALNLADGKLLWQRSQANQAAAGGSHGEQDHHPVLVQGKLLVEPKFYDLSTGQDCAEWDRYLHARQGCGTISASEGALFFRDQHASLFDFRTQQQIPITRATRPGCWINMIPAGGLLLVPEASSGCSCNIPIQATLAFRPAHRVTDRSPAPAAPVPH